MQALRRAVLGQAHTLSTCPTVPTDTVLPVYYFDDTPLLRNSVQCLTLRFNDALDAEMLRGSLSRLLERPGWRKLGGRIRINDNGKLEIHVPMAFASERLPLNFYQDSFDVCIDEHPLASTLPTATSNIPSVQRGPSAFKLLGIPPGAPICLEDYLKSDCPQLTVHVVSFTDATLVSLCWPHICADAMSLREIGAAWSLVLAGRESDIPPMLSAGEDPMARAGIDPVFVERHPLQEQQVQGWWLFLWGVRFILDLLWWRTMETRTVFLPRRTVQELRSDAMASLAETPSSAPFVSDGDVVASWLAVTATEAILTPNSTRTVSIANAFDLRRRCASLFPAEKEKGAYVQNAVFPCWTTLPASQILAHKPDALGIVAQAIRESIKTQTTEASVHALARLTRESLEKSGIPPMFGDTSSLVVNMSNWSKASLFESLDFGPAIVNNTKHGGRNRASAEGATSLAKVKSSPVYYHVQGVSPNNMLARNGAFLTSTPNGDYWINGCFPPEVWNLIESKF